MTIYLRFTHYVKLKIKRLWYTVNWYQRFDEAFCLRLEGNLRTMTAVKVERAHWQPVTTEFQQKATVSSLRGCTTFHITSSY